MYGMYGDPVTDLRNGFSGARLIHVRVCNTIDKGERD